MQFHWKDALFGLLQLMTACHAWGEEQKLFNIGKHQASTPDSVDYDLRSIPGNSPFHHCSTNFTDDVLDIEWVSLVPNEAHIGHGIQIMVNGTLGEEVSKNATIRVHLAKKGSRFQPLDFLWDFCHPLEEVIQDDGPRCPPRKGGVEITAHAFVWFVHAGDVIETTIEALTPQNKTIACLYGEVDVVREGADMRA